MSEFLINPRKTESIAEMLDRQADKLESTQMALDSISSNLCITGGAKSAINSSIKRVSGRIGKQSVSATQMATALRNIAQQYRLAEGKITGSWINDKIRPDRIRDIVRKAVKGWTIPGRLPGSSKFSPDPVNLCSGNFILENCDMVIPGTDPLCMNRFYNSMNEFSGLLGSDWTTDFDVSLSFENGSTESSVSIRLEDGRKEYFVNDEENKYIPVSGTTAELSASEDGYSYCTLDGRYYLFNNKGIYVRNENAHHVGYSLSYNNHKLEKVEKDSGEYFIFKYNEDGYLSKVEDHAGRTTQYVFNNGHLAEAILSDGNKYSYTYGENGKIKTVKNPLSIKAVETEYDDLFRVVFQKFADGTTNTFEYMDAQNAVVMTERNGVKSIHYHNDLNQNIKNVYADGEESFDYNSKGQKIRITDKLGHTFRMQYDGHGNLSGLIMANGDRISATYNERNKLLNMSVNGENKVKNTYNKYGDLIISEDGLGRKTEYSYDQNGRATKVILPDNSIITTEYDNSGNLIRVKNASGGIITWDYNELNRMIRHTDEMGFITSYEYDLMGRVTAQIRNDGSSRMFSYDAWGNPVSMTDFDGSVVNVTYNENNLPAMAIDEEGRKTVYRYDSMWNVSEIIMPNGGTLRYEFDNNNNLQKELDPYGNMTLYTYDSEGNVISITDKAGNTTSYEWDSCRRCRKVVYADGTFTEYGYNADDQVVYVHDAEGQEIFREFNAAGELILEKDSSGHFRKYAHNSLGLIISVIDENELETKYQYDPGSDRITSVLHPNGMMEKYEYDKGSKLIKYIDIFGAALEYKYDNLNRLTELYGEQGIIKKISYDPMGRILSETDCNDNTLNYSYTLTGQLKSATDALGNKTLYSYDMMDQLIGIQRMGTESAVSISTKYERDLMGQLMKIIDPSGNSESYKYDKMGRIASKVDREGNTTEYNYDSIGMLKSVLWADGREASFQYNRQHRLEEVNDWTGKTRFSYDMMGNLSTIVYPDESKALFNYDKDGNRIQAGYPNGSQLSYEYDRFSRLTKVLYNGESIHYKYDKNGQLCTKVLPDRSQVDYQYDKGSLVGIKHISNHQLLNEISIGYDIYGRRKSYDLYRSGIPSANGSYKYEYDAAGRLESIYKNNQLIRKYTYDSLGNRIGKTSKDPKSGKINKTEYSYDLRGGLLSLKCNEYREDYRYDKRGNLTTLLRNGNKAFSYQYDVMNRLTDVNVESGESAQYTYNGLGYRVNKILSSERGTKRISYKLDYSKIYDNLLELNEGGKNESYAWGVGLEGYFDQEGNTGWYLTDSLGSVLEKRDYKGVIYEANYDEFGNGDLATNLENIFGYNGFLFDSTAGTYFAQARQYRQYTGTFDAMDRFGGDITQPETLNPYIYCIHDPFSHTDKSAYWFGIDDAIAAGVGAVGGLAGQLIGDVVTGVTEGKWEFKWQEYAGAATGGAAGGVTTLYAGPIAGGAVAGGVTRLTTEGLTYVSDPKGYTKSGWDVAKETLIDTGMGALSGAVSKFVGNATKKIANTKTVQKIAQGLQSKGGLFGKIGNHIINTANGVASKLWSEDSKFLKNNIKAILANKNVKKAISKYLIGNIPKYLAQEIIGKLIDKVKPSKAIWDMIKKYTTNWLKNTLGIVDQAKICVPVPVI